MNIVVIEDEQSLNQFLVDSLTKIKCEIHTGHNMDDIHRLIEQKSFEPDVILLDRLLGGVDSSEKIPALKERFANVRILVLSAIGGPSEKGRILDSGADDYISKPFSIEELLARIRVMQRHSKRDVAKVQEYGNVVINLFNQTAEVSGKRLDLSKKEYQLLTALLHTPTRVFNRYQLLDTIWDIHADVESNVVEVTVKNLRKKLEQSHADVQILSKRNVGYWVEV